MKTATARTTKTTRDQMFIQPDTGKVDTLRHWLERCTDKRIVITTTEYFLDHPECWKRTAANRDDVELVATRRVHGMWV